MGGLLAGGGDEREARGGKREKLRNETHRQKERKEKSTTGRDREKPEKGRN